MNEISIRKLRLTEAGKFNDIKLPFFVTSNKEPVYLFSLDGCSCDARIDFSIATRLDLKKNQKILNDLLDKNCCVKLEKRSNGKSEIKEIFIRKP